MSDLKNLFETAAEDAQKLAKRPNNDDMLKLYAFFKQATKGDVSGKRPGMFDPVGRAKYDAWTKVKGQDSDTAMQAYVDLVESLK